MEYIEKNLQDEKGIINIEENHLKKDNKIILYSHFFFARLYNEIYHLINIYH